ITQKNKKKKKKKNRHSCSRELNDDNTDADGDDDTREEKQRPPTNPSSPPHPRGTMNPTSEPTTPALGSVALRCHKSHLTLLSYPCPTLPTLQMDDDPQV